MKLSELDKANGDHRDSVNLQAGEICEYFFDDGLMAAWVEAKIVGFDGPATVVAVDGEGYFGSSDYSLFRPIKSEAEKRRDEQIEKMTAAYYGDLAMMPADGDLHIQWQYKSGCRMTRELTDDVINKIWFDTKKGDDFTQRFAHAIAAYVTGSGEYE